MLIQVTTVVIIPEDPGIPIMIGDGILDEGSADIHNYLILLQQSEIEFHGY